MADPERRMVSVEKCVDGIVQSNCRIREMLADIATQLAA
jgi:hypothetical protein